MKVGKKTLSLTLEGILLYQFTGKIGGNKLISTLQLDESRYYTP